MKQIRTWISNHENITMCLVLLSVLLIRGQGGAAASPGFVIILFFLGLPTIFGIGRGFVSIYGREFLSSSTRVKMHIILLTIILLFLSLGIIAFLYVFLLEFYGQLTCRNCAQGGLGVFTFLPIAWLSYLFVWMATGCFTWPCSLKPDFSFMKR
jgi:hypothetical protein